MTAKISPLAPASYPEMPAIAGVRIASVEAGIKYRGRKDLTAILFDQPAQVAGVFTRSKCASAPVDWCRAILPDGIARAVVVNSGNANAFTGMKGIKAVSETAKAAAEHFSCKPEEVFISSTGVIGEPLDTTSFSKKLAQIARQAQSDGWADAAKAIMTTDTYPKMATRSFEIDGRSYLVNGIAKGSGMIAPDMATMLAFVVTDLPIAASVLQRLLKKASDKSFNCVTVDSDTSTSDTVLLFSVGEGEHIEDVSDPRLRQFRKALEPLLLELAMHLVRDGEGATKHVEVTVRGAASRRSARRIALAIANSPLVKTAIAGEDANWGRIVMAVGKAGEPADRDALSIHFGDVRVAFQGERDPDYDESSASRIVKGEFIPIIVNVGVGKSEATVWTCDLTKEYIAINADYRS